MTMTSAVSMRDATYPPAMEMSLQQRKAWDGGRADLMRKIVKAKFADPQMARRLLATGNAELEENNPGESAPKSNGFRAFWGTGKDGKGDNWHGRILMEVRDDLRASARASSES